MPRRGRHRKKTRTHVVATDERITSALHSNDDLKVPRSLVVRRGKVESEIAELVADVRNLLRPYTALNFKEDASNRKMTLNKYASELTGPLGITHVIGLSQNGSKISLRVGRTPGGPTLTFRVKRFTLVRQVRMTRRRPFDATSKSYDSPPIVVTNNFGDVSAPPHVKLMRITFQNMFPAINVSTVKLGDCRRVVLFNLIRRNNGDDTVDDDDDDDDDNETTAKYKRKEDANDDDDDDDNDLEDEEVEIRHYAIRTKPIGIDRRVRRIVESKIPNLGKLYDIADYIAKSSSSQHNDEGNVGGDGYQSMSDSEAEDESNQVELPTTSNKKRKKGGGGGTSSNASSNGGGNKSALKLVELGPRLRLKLYKVERLLCAGDVMYHAYVTKTPAEILALRSRKDEESRLKKRRREEQEGNVQRKQMALEEKKTAREARRKEREDKAMSALRGEIEEGGRGGENVNGTEEEKEEEDYDNDDSDSDEEDERSSDDR